MRQDSHHACSSTFVLADGRQVSGYLSGEVDTDEKQDVVRGYAPFEGDPLAVFRETLRPKLPRPTSRGYKESTIKSGVAPHAPTLAPTDDCDRAGAGSASTG